MCAILQLVSAPLNPIPIAEHFRNFSEDQFFAHLTLKTFNQLVHHLYSQTQRFESPYTTK